LNIFNALHGNIESETYNYLTKEKIQDIAQTVGVQELLFEEGYMENDITIGFFR